MVVDQCPPDVLLLCVLRVPAPTADTGGGVGLAGGAMGLKGLRDSSSSVLAGNDLLAG
jgi:hypothetical protein